VAANRWIATGLLLPLRLAGGCSHKDRDVGERVDPDELYYVPSIIASARRLVDGVQQQSGPLFRRDAHAKAHGCLTATFRVRDDLPQELRSAVFVPGHEYQAWIRFSNGNAALQPDGTKDARGMAIKLMGVPGPKLLDSPYEKDALTQDFLMINFPVFFNRNPQEYENFIRYQADGSKFGYFFQGRNPLDWKWREVVLGGQLLGRIANPLYAQYFSMTAYAMGVEPGPWRQPPPYRRAMKYSARSCTPPATRAPDFRGDDYLRRGLAEHLASADGCFDFLVQLQDPAHHMPIEDPTVKWPESQSAYQPVARITIPAQQFDTPERNAFCENLAFTPWHGHVDHRPLGGLNRIRKAVYEEIAVYRHARNRVPYREPTGWCLRLDGLPCDES
jgi:hypothetical protein